MKNRMWRGVAVAASAVMLSACGGGGLSDPQYSIGGVVSGLSGSVELLMTFPGGSEKLTRTDSGSFTFNTKIFQGGRYVVSVSNQPDAQICTASNNTEGVFLMSSISNISVSCASAAWTVSRYAGSADGTAGNDLTGSALLATDLLLSYPYKVSHSPGGLLVFGHMNASSTGATEAYGINYSMGAVQALGQNLNAHTAGFYLKEGSGFLYFTKGSQVMKADPVIGTQAASVYSSSAGLSTPRDMVRDGDGNLYISDSTDHVIKKIIKSTGEVKTLAGSKGNAGFANGSGAEARFYQPWGLSLDADGNLYVADRLNHAIRKITPSGVVSTLAGSGSFGSTDATGAAASFGYPEGVAVDAYGNVYVADTSNNLIRKIRATGEVSTIAGKSGNEGAALVNGVGLTARFNGPASIAVADSTTLYVADRGNHNVRKMVFALTGN